MSEKLVPFSQCDLWLNQKEFYHSAGIDAWLDKIPFYITNNPAIAHCYASIIIRFMQDCSKRATYNPDQPFYIIELGTGPGKFSYYTCKRLVELRQSLQLNNIPFVYIMTDFTESNISFWQNHPHLQQFTQQGILDFALFDVLQHDEIRLKNSGIVLSEQNMGSVNSNPAIVIANYVFDSIPQDIFSYENNKIKIGKINKSIKIEITDAMNQTTKLDSDTTDYSYHDISMPFYNNKHIDAVLGHYQSIQKDCSILFPVGAMRCIQNLQKITNNKLLLICTDKGSYKDYTHEMNYQPQLMLHNSCFSLSVNFHALEQFFRQCGGDSYHQKFHSYHIFLNTSLFLLGAHFKDLPETSTQAWEQLDIHSFIDIYVIMQHITNTKEKCSLDTLLSLLKITQWDPEVYQRLMNVILEIKNTQPWPIETIREVRGAIPFISNNAYFIPETNDPLSDLGIFFQEGRDFRQAINFFQASTDLYGKKENVLFYMGLCYYYLQDYPHAIEHFTKVLTIKPDNVMARGWIAQIQFEQEKQK